MCISCHFYCKPSNIKYIRKSMCAAYQFSASPFDRVHQAWLTASDVYSIPFFFCKLINIFASRCVLPTIFLQVYSIVYRGSKHPVCTYELHTMFLQTHWYFCKLMCVAYLISASPFDCMYIGFGSQYDIYRNRMDCSVGVQGIGDRAPPRVTILGELKSTINTTLMYRQQRCHAYYCKTNYSPVWAAK